MKNLKMTIVAITIALISFGSFGAQLVNSPSAGQQKSGVIAVSGASDLTALENNWPQKRIKSAPNRSRSPQLPVIINCTAPQLPIIDG